MELLLEYLKNRKKWYTDEIRGKSEIGIADLALIYIESAIRNCEALKELEKEMNNAIQTWEST